ncbi:MAG: phosphotriesterase [Dehalococcoidales bacterium]
MAKSKLAGNVQTVLGQIEPQKLGITLTHEHFFVDTSVWFKEPAEVTHKFLAYQPVSLENLGWVRYHPLSNIDNIRILDEQLAIKEAWRYKLAGGNSVVDVTNIGLGRDPLALTRISRETGLNIIMGAGYYVEGTRPTGMKLTEEIIAKEIIRDVTVGVGNTGIHSGIIGELGMSWPMSDSDKVVLRAAAFAQNETGAPINIHPGYSPGSPFEAIEVLDKAGADISRVVMSHVDRTISDHDRQAELAKTGCYLEFDLFNWEGYFCQRMVLSEENPIKVDLPNDDGRINQIVALINEGFLNQILISHDICQKHRLWHYGGSGYAHILQNVVPLMREKGMSEKQIHTILVENPKRMLTFV